MYAVAMLFRPMKMGGREQFPFPPYPHRQNHNEGEQKHGRRASNGAVVVATRPSASASRITSACLLVAFVWAASVQYRSFQTVSICVGSFVLHLLAQ